MQTPINQKDERYSLRGLKEGECGYISKPNQHFPRWLQCYLPSGYYRWQSCPGKYITYFAVYSSVRIKQQFCSTELCNQTKGYMKTMMFWPKSGYEHSFLITFSEYLYNEVRTEVWSSFEIIIIMNNISMIGGFRKPKVIQYIRKSKAECWTILWE